MSFALLQTSANQAAFMQAARSLLCVKATRDPHDLQYVGEASTHTSRSFV